MEESIQQGIWAELQFVLKPGWVQHFEQDRFRITLPLTVNENAAARAELEDEVWRIARFVAYPNFASISRTSAGCYILKSHMPSGNGYEIIFDPNP